MRDARLTKKGEREARSEGLERGGGGILFWHQPGNLSFLAVALAGLYGLGQSPVLSLPGLPVVQEKLFRILARD